TIDSDKWTACRVIQRACDLAVGIANSDLAGWCGIPPRQKWWLCGFITPCWRSEHGPPGHKRLRLLSHWHDLIEFAVMRRDILMRFDCPTGLPKRSTDRRRHKCLWRFSLED